MPRIQILQIGLLIALLSTGQPVIADMGPAKVTPSTEKPNKTATYDGWCKTKYNDCKISFEGDYLVVDGKHKVSRDQIYSWTRLDEFRRESGLIGPHHLYIYEFRYKSASGATEQGWVVFQNSSASDAFYASLKAWGGTKEKRCEYNFDKRQVVCI